MRLASRISLLAALLCWPLLAAAVAPNGVTNVQATYGNGSVHVTWDGGGQSQSIVSFRIYLSHQSILRNNGSYDDYATTDGRVTEFDLTQLPPVAKLYITVSAVNAAGEESDFVSEASVTLPTAASSASSQTSIPAPASSSSSSPAASATIQLLSAHSVSGKSAILSFSAPVSFANLDLASALQITDATGRALTVLSASALGSFVTLATDSQTPNVLYTVNVAAIAGPATIDLNASTATFLSGATSSESSSATNATSSPEASSASSAPASSSDVSNIHLQSAPDGKGSYTVTADFDAPGGLNIASFEVLQSLDGGQTFLLPQTVAANVRHINFSHVSPGNFALLIRTHLVDGTVSGGAAAALPLPGGAQPEQNVVVNLPKKQPLTQSGPEILVVLAMSGAVAGWRKARRGK